MESSLRIVEKLLRSMKRELELDGNMSDSILYFSVNDIDNKAKAIMLGSITSMLGEIREIQEAFGLTPKKNSVRGKFVGILSEIWVILEEARPEKLEAYGRMPETDKEKLRPHIVKLLKLLDDIYRAL